MRRQLVSFFALLLCITYSITFGAISANATYNTLDDLPIDPVGDLEQFKEHMPNFSQGLIPVLPEREPVEVLPELPSPEQPGGMMLFSMNDFDKLRSFTIRHGSIKFGNRSMGGYYETLVEGDALGFTSNNGTTAIDVIENAQEGPQTYGYIEAGTCVDIEVPFEVPANRILLMNGSGSMGLSVSAHVISPLMYPDSVSIIINGNPVSSSVQLGDMGIFAFSDGEYELDTEVETIGYRFTFDTAKTVHITPGAGESLVYTTSYGLLLSFNDQTTWEFAEQEPEYNGLLNTIVGWLRNMWDAIVSLPGNVANLILDGLSALFLPSEEDILELQNKYGFLFSNRLGFIYEGLSWVFEFFVSFGDALSSAGNYEFKFPGISVPMNGETIVILEETTVSMDNGVMSVLRPVCGTVISLVAVIGIVNVLFSMTVALLSGTSYFEYLKRGRDGDVG